MTDYTNNDTNRKYKKPLVKRFTHAFAGNTTNTPVAITFPVEWFEHRTSQIVRMRLDSLVSDDYTMAGSAGTYTYMVEVNGFSPTSNANTGTNLLALIKTTASSASGSNGNLIFHNNGDNNAYDGNVAQTININIKVSNISTGTYNLSAAFYGTLKFELIDA